MTVTDPPKPRRGSEPYLPPPPATRDDQPDSVDVPRMEPPPPSLEAMVRNGPSSTAGSERDATWIWVAMVLAIGVLVTIYVLHAH
jgi:hypothetical protein